MEKLYALAFEYRKTKLWKKLFDTQLFAVRHFDGTTGYCCVMGNAGEHIALGLYLGEAGLRTLAAAQEAPQDDALLNPIHGMEQMFNQDCLMCSFENKDELRPSELAEARAYCGAHGITLRGQRAWPKFERITPCHIPWAIRDERERQLLAEALEAALEVARKLAAAAPETKKLQAGPPYGREIPLLVKTETGFVWQETALPPWQEPVYPEAASLYDLTLERVLSAKKLARTWACALFLMPRPCAAEEPDEDIVTPSYEPYDAPYFPWVQIIYDIDQDTVVDCEICPDTEDYASVFPNKLLELMEKQGRPRQLLVETERAFALYDALADRLGVMLTVVDQCEGLDDAVADFHVHVGADDGGLDDGEEEGYDLIGDAQALLKRFLTTCKDFSQIPDEALFLLSQMARELADELPKEQLALLKQEIRRRGL